MLLKESTLLTCSRLILERTFASSFLEVLLPVPAQFVISEKADA
jgi:hypothetical protein